MPFHFNGNWCESRLGGQDRISFNADYSSVFIGVIDWFGREGWRHLAVISKRFWYLICHNDDFRHGGRSSADIYNVRPKPNVFYRGPITIRLHSRLLRDM